MNVGRSIESMTTLISACISLLWPHASFQSAGLTIDEVENVSTIVEQLSKSTGQKHNVDPDIGRINMYVCVKDVPAEDLRLRLADLTQATWRKNGTALHLSHTKHEEERIHDGVAKQLSPIYKKDLWETRSGMPDGDAVQVGRFFARDLRSKLGSPTNRTYDGPTSGLLVDILKRIGPDRLASIPAFQTTLFSNQPTSPELPMPDISDLVSRYQEICRNFAKDLPEDSMQGVLDSYDFDHFIVALHHADSIGRILLGAYTSFDRALAILTIYDNKGNIETDGVWSMPIASTPEIKNLNDGSAKMDWPEQTVSLIDQLSRTDPSAIQAPMFQSVFSEPLRLQAIPGLQFLARDSKNILCPLPDQVVLKLFADRPTSIRTFTQSMARAGVSLEIGEKWVTGQLAPNSFNPACFLDRQPLHEWEDRSVAKSMGWLRTTATLYARAGDAASNGLVNWIKLKFWRLLKIDEPILEIPRGALFALGTLSDSEWEDLNRGRNVSAVGVADRSKRIEQWSWQSATALQRVPNYSGPDQELIGSYSFPGGPPESSTLSLTRKTEPIIQFSDDKDGYWMNLGQVANWICAKMNPAIQSEDAILAKVKSRFNVAYRPGFTLHVNLSPALLMSATQSEAQMQIAGTSLAISDWPSDMIAGLKQEIRDFLRDQATKKIVPPPY